MRPRVDDDTPSCTDCGACCFTQLPEAIRVFGIDHDRMDADATALTHFIGNRCYLRLVDGHCASLRIARDAPHFTCAMYEQRPDVCRALEPGSPACRAERWEKTERARAALARQ